MQRLGVLPQIEVLEAYTWSKVNWESSVGVDVVDETEVVDGRMEVHLDMVVDQIRVEVILSRPYVLAFAMVMVEDR